MGSSEHPATTAADGSLAATTFTYDNAGRRTGVTNPLGNTTATGYYANGQVAYVADPLGNTTGYQSDGANRPTVVTDPNGNATTTTYDTAHRRIMVEDPTGAVVTTSYLCKKQPVGGLSFRFGGSYRLAV